MNKKRKQTNCVSENEMNLRINENDDNTVPVDVEETYHHDEFCLLKAVDGVYKLEEAEGRNESKRA